MAELGEGGGSESGEVVEEVLGCQQVVGGASTEEGKGLGVGLARGEAEGWEGEGGVGESFGAEMGGVNLVAYFEGEGEKARFVRSSIKHMAGC